VLLADVVATSAQVAATRSRTEKTAALADLFSRAQDGDVGTVIGLLVAAPPQGRLGLGWSALQQIEPTLGPPVEQPELTVAQVDAAFTALAAPGATPAARRGVLAALLDHASAAERELLSGVLVGEVRQGALESVLADALAQACGVGAPPLRRAWMLTGSLSEAAAVARSGGEQALVAVTMQVGRPVRPMLAASATSVAEALADRAFADSAQVAVDHKLDGARIQVHRDGDEVRIFTRSLKEVTHRLPEVVRVALGLPVTSVVLDGESLVLDEQDRPRAFADTMSRFSADAPRKQVVRPYFFDVLHVDGVDLLDEPLARRLEELERVAGPWRVASTITDDPDVASRVSEAALAAGHEGVVVKSLTAPYEAGRRGSAWQKVKPVRTLDLVVLAAEWGHGRRAGWLSNLHLGARDPQGQFGEPGGFVMVGKTFKGLTDALLAWQTERLQELEQRSTRGTVWIRPELVVEIAFDGAQASSRYPGGAALRFGRVIGYRDDKDAAEADTIGAVREYLRASAKSRCRAVTCENVGLASACGGWGAWGRW